MKVTIKRFIFLGLLLLSAFVFVGCEDLTTTATPTTAAPTTTVAPTTAAPTTVAPTTVAPTTAAPTTVAPTTVAPTTVSTMSDADMVQAFLDSIDLGTITAVTADLTLPTATQPGMLAVWTTTDADVISAAGEITVPDYGDGNATATLRVTVTLNTTTLYREFAITVLEESATSFLTRVGNSILITGSDAITTSFKLPGLAQGATIAWESDKPLIAAISATMDAENLYTVTITRTKVEEGGENETVLLTATISIDDVEVEVVKSIRVIAEPAAVVYTSFATLHSESILNDYVETTGIVYSVYNGGYWLLDGDGKYLNVYTGTSGLFYNVAKLGDQIRIRGLYKNYNTLYQISNLTLQQVLASDQTYTVTPIVVEDALDLNDIEFINPTADKLIHGQIFTVSAMVKVLSNGYVDLYVGAVRLGTVYSYSPATSLAALKTFDGKYVTIDVLYYTLHGTNGTMVTFNGTADDIELVPLTGQDALDADHAALAIPESAYGLDTLVLPVLGAYNSVIAWEILTGGEYATLDGANLTFIDVAAPQVVTVKATLTLGELTPLTKEFEIDVAVLVIIDISDVYGTEIAIGNAIVIKGILTAQTTPSAFWIEDATGGLNIYVPTGMRDAFAQIPIGSEIILYGKKQIYNGLYEIEQLTKYVVTATPVVVPESTSITTNDFTQAGLLPYQGMLVSFEGFQLRAAPTVDTFGTYQFYLDHTDTRTIVVRLDNRTPGYAGIVAQIQQFTPGDIINVSGALINWFNVPQLQLTIHTVLEAPDSVKAMWDVNALVVKTSVGSDEEVVLPIVSGTSAVTWELLPTDHATLVGNTVTYGAVSVATEVTLKATFSYPVTGGDPIVNTKEYVVTISTYEEKLAEDKATLEFPATANELDQVTLPALGTNGSVITWEITAGGVDAGIQSGKLNLGYKGEAYSVSLLATLTLTKADTTTITDTKAFTIEVAPVVVVSVTDAVTAIKALPGSDNILTGDIVFMKGTIIEFKTSGTAGVYSGAYISDGTSVIYAFYAFPKATYAIGDVVLLKGTLKEYYKLQEIDTITIAVKLDETPAVYDPIVATIAQIAAFTSANADTSPYLASTVTVTGTIIKISSSYYITNVENPTVSERLLFYFVEFDEPMFLADLVGQEVTLTAVIGEYRTDGNIRMAGAFAKVVVTDQQRVAMDASRLPATLTLSDDYIVPAPVYGSTYTVTAVSAELTAYIDHTTTPGTLLVTQPTDENKVGTVTITVSMDGATSQEVIIAVTVAKSEEAPELLSLMIYEIYGGGGNTGATFTNDYVVLYNPNTVAVSLVGYSLQYSSATGVFQLGTNNSQVLDLTGSIGAQSFYLIQLAAGTTVTDKPLPVTADITHITNLATTNGKLALVLGPASSPISGIADPKVVDFVGFGTGNQYEGSGPVLGMTNSMAAQRKAFVDTNDNAADFAVVTPSLSYLLP